MNFYREYFVKISDFLPKCCRHGKYFKDSKESSIVAQLMNYDDIFRKAPALVVFFLIEKDGFRAVEGSANM